MSKLPIELINLTMSYMSSPAADIFKKETKEIKDKFDKVDEEFDLSSMKISFAGFYFVEKTFSPYGILDNVYNPEYSHYEILDNLYR